MAKQQDNKSEQPEQHYQLEPKQYQAKDYVTVTAHQTDVQMQVTTVNGDEYAHQGDWIAIGVQGDYHLYSDETFQQLFAPIEGSATAKKPEKSEEPDLIAKPKPGEEEKKGGHFR